MDGATIAAFSAEVAATFTPEDRERLAGLILRRQYGIPAEDIARSQRLLEDLRRRVAERAESD